MDIRRVVRLGVLGLVTLDPVSASQLAGRNCSASRAPGRVIHRLGAVFGLVAAVALGACSNQTVRDLEGVPVTDPDKARLVANVDTYPNIMALCIEGAGFATTTRDAAGAMMRVEAWDAANDGWCGK